jgi:hypothetical protein
MTYRIWTTINPDPNFHGAAVSYVRLIRKLALSMNGIDVSGVNVGDVIELDDARAAMMIDYGWAEACGADDVISSGGTGPSEPRRNHSTPK